jgi:hypothetical protein
VIAIAWVADLLEAGGALFFAAICFVFLGIVIDESRTHNSMRYHDSKRVVAISGGRDYPNRRQVHAVLRDLRATIVVGDCPTGVDHWVREWCDYGLTHGYVYRADWDGLGKAAGPERNGRMLRTENPDLLIAFDNGGPGTNDCIRQAKQLGILTVRVTP